MSNGRRNVAFGNDDLNEGYLPRGFAGKTEPRKSRETVPERSGTARDELGGGLSGTGGSTGTKGASSGADGALSGADVNRGGVEINAEAKITGSEEPRPVIGLTDHPRGTTREELIKNELSDFAKQSPESVAAIIRGILKGGD